MDCKVLVAETDIVFTLVGKVQVESFSKEGKADIFMFFNAFIYICYVRNDTELDSKCVCKSGSFSNSVKFKQILDLIILMCFRPL